MMPKLKPEVKAKWLAALRSGEYAQATGTLYDPDESGYCCLGVLCDLAARDGVGRWAWDDVLVPGFTTNDGLDVMSAMPPVGVLDWAFGPDLPYRDNFVWATDVPMRGYFSADLTALNDGYYEDVSDTPLKLRRYTFAEIADVIERVY